MKLERKGYILILLVILSLIFVSSYPAPTIILRPDIVNIKTYIECSNGNIYTATWNHFQDAVWSCNNTGGEVRLPVHNFTDATYTIDVPPTCDGIKIIGASRGYYHSGAIHNKGTVWYSTTDLPEGFIKFNGTTSPWDFVVRPEISNIAIVGDKTHYQVGINFTHCEFPKLKNIDMTDIHGCGVWLNNNRGTRFEEIDFWYCGINGTHPVVWITSDWDTDTHPQFLKCNFEMCYHQWIAVDYSPASGNVSRRGSIIDCYFEVGSGNISDGILPGEYWTLMGNTILGDSTNSFIRCANVHSRWTRIIGNSLQGGCTDAGTATDAQISISSGDHIILLGNTLYESYYNGIQIGTNADNTTVAHNDIFNQVHNSINIGSVHTNLITDNFGYNNNSLFPIVYQINPPTLEDNCTSFWYNITSGWFYQVFYTYNQYYYLNLSSYTSY